MTVAELITLLSRLPPEMPVFLCDDGIDHEVLSLRYGVAPNDQPSWAYDTREALERAQYRTYADDEIHAICWVSAID